MGLLWPVLVLWRWLPPPARGLPRWVVIDDTRAVVIGTGFVGEQTVTLVTGAGDDQGGQQGPRLPADGVNVLTGG